MIKTLIISSCTGSKAVKGRGLGKEDFFHRRTLKKKEKEINCFYKARDMYRGQQHLRLMEGVNILRQHLGPLVVKLQIVSAGYGLVDEERQIVPYDFSFNSMKAGELPEWSAFLKLNRDVSNAVKDFDLVFFLLGENYLKALQLPLRKVREDQRLVFLCGRSGRNIIPEYKPYYMIEVSNSDAVAFGYNQVGLKGFLFRLFAQEVVKSSDNVIKKVYDDPDSFTGIIEGYRKKPRFFMQNLFPDYTPPDPFYVKKEDYAANYGTDMKYFIPEWDDRVDPGYDFLTDTHTYGRDPYLNDAYSHEIFPSPCYDGILVSKVIIEESKRKQEKIRELGIHDFLRFPKDYPVMGDCGAFGYFKEEVPPYETDEILQFYEDMGFNIGVSIDHLIAGNVEKDAVERFRRYEITRDNAADFIGKYNEGSFSFTPSGIAQGWDAMSYRDAVRDLIDMGYWHISLGGLVKTKTHKIMEILKAIAPLLKDHMQLHLFGIARLDAIEAFRKLGVTSFDSASPLRQAWLGAGSNYYAPDGQRYTAIRVPSATEKHARVKKIISEGRGTLEEIKGYEKQALEKLRLFDKRRVSLEDTLQALLAYDRLLGDGRGKHPELYRRLLEDTPWKKCRCTICLDIGIEVVIFRGNNRNRRRGFHNTYVFYEDFKKIKNIRQ